MLILSGFRSVDTGCSAAWLARLTGGQKVGGSNPLIPILPSCLHGRGKLPTSAGDPSY